MDCTNINLKKGSKGTQVSLLQTNLKTLKFYDGKIDGDFGSYTEESVKQFQKKYELATDGVFGPVSCKKLNSLMQNDKKYSYYSNGIYYSGQHWVGTGCNKMGQCTGYYCADCSMKQQFTKLNIDNYSQSKLAGYAGTTTRGTSHAGIETAIAKVAKLEGVKLNVTWKNFSDLGNNQRERFKALGELISNSKKSVILHTLYRQKFGHYETVKEVNMNNNTCLVLNSLGSKCNSPAYCGYKETRSFNELARNLAGISQKSLCIISKE